MRKKLYRQIEMELVQAEYILCKRAADNEGMQIEDWLRRCVLDWLRALREGSHA